MPAEQIIFSYTNEENGKVLKKIARSPGILKSEEEELKTLSDKLKSTRDTSYTYLRLDSEKYSMIKTLIPEDGQGVIVHALIFEKPDYYPYEIIDSPDFSTGAIKYEELKTLENITKGPHRQNPEVIDFMSSREEESLEDILNLLIFSQRRGKSMLIVDSKRAFLNWIIGILSAFPTKIASGISFTTNELIAENKCTLMLGSSSNQSDKLLVFDFPGGVKSSVDVKYRYSQLIRTGYFKARNLMVMLHRFFDQFNYSVLGDEIDNGCRGFLLLQYSNIKLPPEEITGGLHFLLSYGGDETLTAIIERYGSSLEEVIKGLNPSGSKYMIDISLRGIKDSTNRHVCDRAIGLFYETLDYMAFNLRAASEQLYGYYHKGEEASVGKLSFNKYQVAGQRIMHLRDRLEDSGAQDKHEFYTYMILRSFIKTGYTWNQSVHTEGFEVFIDTAIRNIMYSRTSVEFILESVKENREFSINLIMLIFNRMDAESYMELLGREIKQLAGAADEREAHRIRREIFQRGGGKLLLQEFKVLLEENESKREYFKYYKENILSSLAEFSSKYYQEIVVEYLKELPQGEAFEESLQFLGDSSRFERNALENIIKIFEKNISLNNVESLREYIRDAAKIKRSRDIKTYPDITYLLDILFYMEENRDLSVDELIDDINFNLKGMREEFLIPYINLFFTRILLHVRSKEDHRQVVGFVFREGAEENTIYYFGRIINLFMSDKSRGYRPFAHYISFYFFFIEPFHRGKEDGIVDHIETRLREIFDEESREFLEGIDRDIREEFENKGFSIPIKWFEMYARALEGKTLKGKLRKMFGRG